MKCSTAQIRCFTTVKMLCSLFLSLQVVNVHTDEVQLSKKRSKFSPMCKSIFPLQIICNRLKSTDLALTSRIRANFLFSKESGSSCFCFLHFLFSAFSCSSRWTSALFFDLCISWRRSYINMKETN